MKPLWALLRSALFALPPEASHRLTLAILGHPLGAGAAAVFAPNPVSAPRDFLGLRLRNPVGLAAGLDKDGACIDAWAALGFGFIELGTVTPRPQPGNPRPRLFRLPAQRALINRMGFNNRGVEHLLGNLRRARRPIPVGVNIGKNRDTPLERAVDDYLACLERLHADADYLTVNLSSPNTPGLRDLQAESRLRALLEPLMERRDRLLSSTPRRLPVLIKLAPDLVASDLERIAALAEELGVDGIVATNTTIARPGLENDPRAEEPGGLSGAPLHVAAVRTIAALRSASRLPIIGVGGIDSVEAAARTVAAGANCVQLYTGFIYEGPGLVGDIARWFTEQGGQAD